MCEGASGHMQRALILDGDYRHYTHVVGTCDCSYLLRSVVSYEHLHCLVPPQIDWPTESAERSDCISFLTGETVVSEEMLRNENGSRNGNGVD